MQSPEQTAAIECDVFCRVVDNFGDAAVAWRLARILAREHGYRVRLLIDQTAVLARLLQRNVNDPLPWQVDDVVIDRFDHHAASSASLLIETFGCGLPAGFMAARPLNPAPPLLINVEYLSAEQWPDGVHGLSSPARGEVPKRYFFFPGFTAATGGLLREAGLVAQRHEFQTDPSLELAFWERLGVMPDAAGTRRVSMFCYDAGFPDDWFESLSAHGQLPLHLILAEGVMVRQVLHFCGSDGVGSTRHSQNLRVTVVPFLLQPDYDQLLLACHGNVARGEDSFVRAQLAGRPMLWDIYPQDEHAHIAKQQAFEKLYCAAWPRQAALDYQLLSAALESRSASLPECFRRWCDDLGPLQRYAKVWVDELDRLPELGAQLAIFAEKLLK